MGKKDKYYHQKLSSFINPAWCLVPPPPPPPSNTTTTNSSNRHHKKSSATRKQQHRSPRAAVEEPASPIVGCMGQVRRCKRPASGARASGSVRSDSSSSSSSSRSRSASPPNPSADHSSVLRLDNMLKLKGFSTLTRVETVDGMDPPRLVEKEKKKEGAHEYSSVSLWKRRCGGGGALQLQLQLQLQIQPQMVQIC